MIGCGVGKRRLYWKEIGGNWVEALGGTGEDILGIGEFARNWMGIGWELFGNFDAT